MALVEIERKSIQEIIRKMQDQYDNISQDKMNQAVSRALNRTASSGRTAANQEIRKIYNISASKLNSEFFVKRSSKSNLTAEIRASGAPLSLTNFQAKQETKKGTTSFSRKGVASSRLTRKARNNAVKGVTMTIRKGQQVNIPTAFIQTSNGGLSVFARGLYAGGGEGFIFAKERLPMSKLTTASVPLMFANNDVLNPVGRKVDEVLSDRIEHEIRFILGM